MYDTERREYARRVVSNPTPHSIRDPHSDVKAAVERKRPAFHSVHRLACSQKVWQAIVTGKDLTIVYEDADVLVSYKDKLCVGGEKVAPNHSVHYNRDGEDTEVVFYSAAKMLGSNLFSFEGQVCKHSGFDRDMAISDTPETDTRELQTGEPPYLEKTVVTGLCVNFNAEGWAMGVVIERPAELLWPYPLAESAVVA